MQTKSKGNSSKGSSNLALFATNHLKKRDLKIRYKGLNLSLDLLQQVYESPGLAREIPPHGIFQASIEIPGHLFIDLGADSLETPVVEELQLGSIILKQVLEYVLKFSS